MSDDLIRRAEQALEGITPGPWIHEMTVEGGENCHYVRDDGREHLAVFTGNYGGAVADAEFIAAAPDLVRDLLAAVKRVEALADEWAALAVPPTYASMDNGYAAAEVRRALAGEVDE